MTLQGNRRAQHWCEREGFSFHYFCHSAQYAFIRSRARHSRPRIRPFLWQRDKTHKYSLLRKLKLLFWRGTFILFHDTVILIIIHVRLFIVLTLFVFTHLFLHTCVKRMCKRCISANVAVWLVFQLYCCYWVINGILFSCNRWNRGVINHWLDWFHYQLQQQPLIGQRHF